MWERGNTLNLVFPEILNKSSNFQLSSFKINADLNDLIFKPNTLVEAPIIYEDNHGTKSEIHAKLVNVGTETLKIEFSHISADGKKLVLGQLPEVQCSKN